MPPPAPNQCHFPVKKNGRIVWCGEETRVIDPNTGTHLMWCAKHLREKEEAMRNIRNGHKDYPRGAFVAGKITMHK